MSESHIRIRNDFFRNPEYIKFHKSTKGTLYCFLEANITRGSKELMNPRHGGYYIYKQHFLKHQLVCRYSQNNLAGYLQTSQSSISKYLKELEEEGFITVIKRATKIGIINYYQLGTWEGEYGKGSYTENIWLKDIFSMFVLEQKKEKEKIQKEESKKAGERLRKSYGDDLLWKLDFGDELEEDEKVPELSKT